MLKFERILAAFFCLAIIGARLSLAQTQTAGPPTTAQVRDDHRIIPGHRIGPISLGMTTAEVYRILGAPARGLGDGQRYSWSNGLIVAFVDGRVDELELEAGGEAYTLDGGIHVGSSEFAVQQTGPTPSRVGAISPAGQYYCYSAGLKIFVFHRGFVGRVQIVGPTNCN